MKTFNHSTPPADDAAIPDELLVRQAQRGDVQAFSELVLRYFHMVYVVAFGYMKQHESAEDLAQETFLRAYGSLATVRDGRYFPAWLNQIARNHALNWLKQGTRRSRVITMLPIDSFESEPDDTTPSAREAASAREEARQLEEAILALPEELRTTVLLHYTADLSKSEIARRLGVHPSSVGRQLDKAIMILRGKLGAAGERPALQLPARQDGVAKTVAMVAAFAALSSASQASLMQALGHGAALPSAAAPGVLAKLASAAGGAGVVAWSVAVATVVAVTIGGAAWVSDTFTGASPAGAQQVIPAESTSTAGMAVAASKFERVSVAGGAGHRSTVGAAASNRVSSGAGTSGSRSGIRRLHATARERQPQLARPAVLVSGRVLYFDQSLVTSATVELWSYGDAGADQAKLLDAAPVGPEGDYAVLGSDGFGLSVRVKGASPAIADIAPPAKHDPNAEERLITQDFILPMPHVVRGRVVDANDAAVTSATVSLRSEDEFTDGWYFGNQQTTVSQTGDFEIAEVAAGKATVGAVGVDGEWAVSEIVVPTTGAIVLKLIKGTATITGTVLEHPTNAPLGAAEITARASGNLGTLGLRKTATTTAGADGRFQFDQLAEGKTTLSARDAAGNKLYLAPDEPGNALAPVAVANGTTDVALRMYRGFTFSGTVFDQETSEPMAGAVVQVYKYDELLLQVSADSGGRYKFDNLDPVHRYKLGVAKGGFILALDDDYEGAEPAVKVAPAKGKISATQDLPMVPAVTVSGRVQTTAGLPIQGATLVWESRPHTGPAPQTMSDPEGRFKFTVGPHRQGLIKATAPGFGYKLSSQIDVVTANVENVTVAMEQEAIVEGGILSNDHVPVAGATVAFPVEYHLGKTRTSSEDIVALSGADGSYRLAGVPAGKGEIAARAANYTRQVREITAKPGEHLTGVDVHLGPGYVIEGKVVDGAGKPQAGLVIINRTDQPHVTAGLDGKFRFEGLAAGEVKIEARTPAADGQATAQAGDRDVVIVADGKPLVIRCLVVDAATGEPVKELVLGDGPWVTKDEPVGGFRFSTNRPSQITMSVQDVFISAEGYPKHYFVIRAPANEGDVVKLEMSRGSVLQGRVVAMPGADPVANATVTATYDQGVYGQMSSSPPITTTVTDAEGRFTLANLPKGKLFVKALPALPLHVASKDVEVREGGIVDVGDIKVGYGGTIRGRVVRVPATPVAHQPMELQGPYGPVGKDPYGETARVTGATTDAKGEFVVRDLAPGRYQLTMQKRENYEQSVELSSGETKDVVMQLGAISAKGNLTRGGAPVNGTVTYVHKETGQRFKAAERLASSYNVGNLLPGDYEIVIGYMKSTNVYSHTKLQATIGDEPVATRHFEVPVEEATKGTTE